MVEGALVGGVVDGVVVEVESAGRYGGEDVLGGWLVLCVTELLAECGRVLGGRGSGLAGCGAVVGLCSVVWTMVATNAL